MVVFSCDGCGEMLKKQQVDSHAARCRRCDSVCCLDCNVSFYGDDFRAHTSCISEAERYEKSVYRGGSKKVKKNPQEAWNELIASASSTAPATIRHYMETLASLDNVPRKPKQFRNFTANSLNLRGKHATDVVDSMWNHLSQLREKELEAKKSKQEEEQKRLKVLQETKKKETEPNNMSNDSSIEAGKDHKSNNESTRMSEESTVQDGKESNGKRKEKNVSAKKVRKAMKKVLKKAPDRKMKLKHLRRAVRQHLECGDSAKPRVKQLIGEEIASGGNERIKVEGKLVILQ